MARTVSCFRRLVLGPMVVRYMLDRANGQMGLALTPLDSPVKPALRRDFLSGVEIDAYATANHTRFPAWRVDSLVQLKAADDPYSSSFGQGRTMRNSATVERLRFLRQKVLRSRVGISVHTTFRHKVRGWLAHHELTWSRGATWIESSITVENTSKAPLTLEMIASFSIGGITPYAPNDGPGRLRLHRFRTTWSMEGRLDSQRFEDLQLEPAWIVHGMRSERFGALGSMPTNGFMPRVAVEDTVAGVTWGAQLAQPGSWQLEIYRRDDLAAISGGLADREFGHWMKTLPPQESFVTPRAFVACVAGGIDELCDALNSAQARPLADLPQSENALPLLFNEWATSWGQPSHANMVALARKLRGLGPRYLVIDAGWFTPVSGAWNTAHGDWLSSRKLYPQGLRATAEAIRAEGLVPGLWFEMETAGANSALFKRTELLLHRDGLPLTVGGRRFLDLRKKAAVDYLARKVIGTLREGGFGYLKVDYNENIGLGVDGAESPGEGLRLHLEGVQAFFRQLRAELPELVIENCSSGGHRLEPSMFALSAMSSFSDAHECREIPIIAANLHRLMLPQQSQIWVVLRSGESTRRTLYSLAAGFLGRLCFSGDFLKLSPAQLALVQRASVLYHASSGVIRSGVSRRHGPEIVSYRHPEGWQAVVRLSSDKRQVLVVAHVFARPSSKSLEIPLPPGAWRITDGLWAKQHIPILSGPQIVWQHGGAWSAFVALVKRP